MNNIFWEDDVKDILSIPVRPGYEDFVAWHYDAKGMFSVNSAYHVLDDRKEHLATRQRGEASGSGATDPTHFRWTRIWKLSITPKVRQFIWRLVHNSLPMKNI